MATQKKGDMRRLPKTLMDCEPGDEVEVYEIGRCLVTGDAIGPNHDYRLIRRIVDGEIALRFEPVPSSLVVSQVIVLR